MRKKGRLNVVFLDLLEAFAVRGDKLIAQEVSKIGDYKECA